MDLTRCVLSEQLCPPCTSKVNKLTRKDELKSDEIGWKLWTTLPGEKSRGMHNIWDVAMGSKEVGKVFPKDHGEDEFIKLMKGPKVSAAQRQAANERQAKRNKSLEDARAARQNGGIDMSGYAKLGVTVNADGSCMDNSYANLDPKAKRDYADCQFAGAKGIRALGNGHFQIDGDIFGEMMRDPRREQRERELEREMANRDVVEKPRSDPQTSWPPRLEVVEDDKTHNKLSTLGELFDYARKERVMRVTVVPAPPAEDSPTQQEFMGASAAGSLPQPPVVMAVKVSTRLPKHAIARIMASEKFRSALRPRPQPTEEDSDELRQARRLQQALVRFPDVWERVQSELEEEGRLVSASDLIELYGEMLGGRYRRDGVGGGRIHRDGAIGRGGENDDRFYQGRAAVRKFFKVFGGSDSEALSVSWMRFSVGERPIDAAPAAYEIPFAHEGVLPHIKS